jgi:hypothetical protein
MKSKCEVQRINWSIGSLVEWWAAS